MLASNVGFELFVLLGQNPAVVHGLVQLVLSSVEVLLTLRRQIFISGHGAKLLKRFVHVSDKLIHAFSCILVCDCLLTSLLSCDVRALGPGLLLDLEIALELTWAGYLVGLSLSLLFLLFSRLFDHLDRLADYLRLLIVAELLVNVTVSLRRRHLLLFRHSRRKGFDSLCALLH